MLSVLYEKDKKWTKRIYFKNRFHIPLRVEEVLLFSVVCGEDKNKPERANRCIQMGLAYNHNVFHLFSAIFGGFAELLMDGRMNGRTYGRTDPVTEMRRRI